MYIYISHTFNNPVPLWTTKNGEVCTSPCVDSPCLWVKSPWFISHVFSLISVISHDQLVPWFVQHRTGALASVILWLTTAAEEVKTLTAATLGRWKAGWFVGHIWTIECLTCVYIYTQIFVYLFIHWKNDSNRIYMRMLVCVNNVDVNWADVTTDRATIDGDSWQYPTCCFSATCIS